MNCFSINFININNNLYYMNNEKKSNISQKDILILQKLLEDGRKSS